MFGLAFGCLTRMCLALCLFCLSWLILLRFFDIGQLCLVFHQRSDRFIYLSAPFFSRTCGIPGFAADGGPQV